MLLGDISCKHPQSPTKAWRVEEVHAGASLMCSPQQPGQGLTWDRGLACLPGIGGSSCLGFYFSAGCAHAWVKAPPRGSVYRPFSLSSLHEKEERIQMIPLMHIRQENSRSHFISKHSVSADRISSISQYIYFHFIPYHALFVVLVYMNPQIHCTHQSSVFYSALFGLNL